MGEALGAEADQGEPAEGRADGAGGEDPAALFAVLVGDTAEHDERVHIGCGVEPRERHGTEDRLDPGRSRSGAHQGLDGGGRIGGGGGGIGRLGVLNDQGFALGLEGVAEAEVREIGEVDNAGVLEDCEDHGVAVHEVTHAGGAGEDEYDVGECAGQHNRADMVAFNAHLDDVGILGTDGDDKRQAEGETGDED